MSSNATVPDDALGGGTSTEALLASLAKVQRRTPLSPRPTVELPLPDLMVRALIVAALLLIGGWCLLLWWFSRDAVSLADGIRQRQEHLRAASHPVLPLGPDLMAEGALDEAVLHHPGMAVRLRLLRAEARATAGDRAGACEDYRVAQEDALGGLEPVDRLRWAEHLASLGRSTEALPLLWSLRLGSLAVEDRQRAIGLLSELSGVAGTAGH